MQSPLSLSHQDVTFPFLKLAVCCGIHRKLWEVSVEILAVSLPCKWLWCSCLWNITFVMCSQGRTGWNIELPGEPPPLSPTIIWDACTCPVHSLISRSRRSFLRGNGCELFQVKEFLCMCVHRNGCSVLSSRIFWFLFWGQLRCYLPIAVYKMRWLQLPHSFSFQLSCLHLIPVTCLVSLREGACLLPGLSQRWINSPTFAELHHSDI